MGGLNLHGYVFQAPVFILDRNYFDSGKLPKIYQEETLKITEILV